MEKNYNKLVRDKIPEKIKKNDEVPIYHELSNDEYWLCLLDKDSEELEEVRNAPNREEVKKELADKLEIIKAMAQFHGYQLEDIIKESIYKKEKNGGFQKRYFLEKVIT